MLCSTCTSGTCYDKTLPSVLLCMRCQGARIVPGHPVYVMLVPMVTTGCLACAKPPEVYDSAARVCANDAQSRAWLACGDHTCLCFMSRANQGWSPSPCFASFEGVAPAVLPILYSTIGGSPRLRVQGNPGLLTLLCTAAHPPC